MKLKAGRAQFKAPGEAGTDTGTFEAIVSVFNNRDSWGEVVLPGAFKESIAQWKSGGDALPVLWSHRMDDPTFNIGAVLDIEELEPGDTRLAPDWVDPHVKDNGGLWVRARIDSGADASPVAVHALRLLKERRVTQFSYAYDELDAGPIKIDGEEVWGLKRLALHEVSPTQVGANGLTELLGAKNRLGALLKTGRALSTKNEANIRQAVDLLNDTLAALDGDTGDDEKAKREEPRLKREEPNEWSKSIRLAIDRLENEPVLT